MPVLPAEPAPAPRAPTPAPLEGERLLPTCRLFSASLCCSPAPTPDEILRKPSLFIHFDFLPSPVAAYNSHELRDRLIGFVFLSWAGYSGWCCASRGASLARRVRSRRRCSLVHPSASPAAGILNCPALEGAPCLPPAPARGRAPHRTRSSAQKSQGDAGLKAEAAPPGPVLRDGSLPSPARSQHEGKKPEGARHPPQIQAEEVRVLWGQPLHGKKRDPKRRWVGFGRLGGTGQQPRAFPPAVLALVPPRAPAQCLPASPVTSNSSDSQALPCGTGLWRGTGNKSSVEGHGPALSPSTLGLRSRVTDTA